MSTKYLFCIVVSGILILMGGCKKDKESNPEDLAFKGISVAATGDAQYPYVAIDKNGNYLAVQTNSSKTTVESAVFVDKGGRGFSVYMDDDGRPIIGYSGGYIFLYDNYTSSGLDVAVIYPSGDIKLFREVEVDYDFSKTSLKSSESLSVREALKYASIALSVASCVAGYISAPAGIGVPVAIACTAALINVITALVPSDDEALNISTGAFGYYASIVGCGSSDPFACAGLVVDLAGDYMDATDEAIVDQEEIIYIASAALYYGGGDIQVTLTWDNTSDLDLWVTDPYQEKIYWNNPYSSSGGYLDVDDMNGYGPENIFWLANTAPAGKYIVELDYYSGSGVVNFLILIQAGSEIAKVEGSINPQETYQIATITISYNKSVQQTIEKLIAPLSKSLSEYKGNLNVY